MLATLHVSADRELLSAALLGLLAVNVVLMRRGGVPALYGSGIRYQREVKGREDWKDCARVAEDREGDCEDLACYRAAELVSSGEDLDARPAVIWTSPRMLHAVVRRGDGSYEDPSRRLGMKGPRHARR